MSKVTQSALAVQHQNSTLLISEAVLSTSTYTSIDRPAILRQKNSGNTFISSYLVLQ